MDAATRLVHGCTVEVLAWLYGGDTGRDGDVGDAIYVVRLPRNHTHEDHGRFEDILQEHGEALNDEIVDEMRGLVEDWETEHRRVTGQRRTFVWLKPHELGGDTNEQTFAEPAEGIRYCRGVDEDGTRCGHDLSDA